MWGGGHRAPPACKSVLLLRVYEGSYNVLYILVLLPVLVIEVDDYHVISCAIASPQLGTTFARAQLFLVFRCPCTTLGLAFFVGGFPPAFCTLRRGTVIPCRLIYARMAYKSVTLRRSFYRFVAGRLCPSPASTYCNGLNAVLSTL